MTRFPRPKTSRAEILADDVRQNRAKPTIPCLGRARRTLVLLHSFLSTRVVWVPARAQSRSVPARARSVDCCLGSTTTSG